MTLCSAGLVAVVVWLAFLAQVPANSVGNAVAMLLFAGLLAVSLFGALVCPSAAKLASTGVRDAANLARLAVSGAALASAWVIIYWWAYGTAGLTAAEPGWQLAVLLVAPPLLYIAVRPTLERVLDGAFRQKVLVIGDEGQIRTVTAQLTRQSLVHHPGTTMCFDAGAEAQLSGEIKALVARERVRRIVVAFRDRRGNRIAMSTLLELKMRGVEVLDATRFIEHETGRVELEGLHPGWIVYSEGFRGSRLFRAVKRTIDIVFSAVVLTICAPLMLLTALAVRLQDGGPAIYRQTRVGFAGAPFVVFKFRSMRMDAEAIGHPVWAKDHDPRVTPVGRLIRATRIDELPQLFNVLKGEMSLVGPRPERPQFVEVLKHQIEYYDLRHYALPGITGWAQINLGYTGDAAGAMRKLSYDLYYMKHASIWLELYIFARTWKTIIWGKGAR